MVDAMRIQKIISSASLTVKIRCDVFVTKALYHQRMAKEEEQTTRYASYLLRFRLVRNDDQPIWIASIDNTATGSHRSFPNVEALAAFLLAEFGGRRTGVKDGPESEEGDKQLIKRE